MPGRGDQDQALVDECMRGVAPGQLGMDRTDHDVDLTPVQPGDEVGDEAGPERERDARVAAAERSHRCGQINRPEDRRGADADMSAQHVGELVQVGAGSVELLQDAPGPCQEQLAAMGEGHPAGGALQEYGSQLGLQAPDLGRDRRLGHAELLGGAGEAAVPHDRIEIDELAKLHRFIMDRDESQHKMVLDLSLMGGHRGVMEQRQLGRTGLATSALGLGCMGFSQGYGATDDRESITSIHRAIELGVTMLDTAMSYGQGHNESLIARALSALGEQAHAVQVATKFGIVRRDQGVHLDGKPEHVRGHAEASLERLGVDVIDLYYLHRVDPDIPIAETVEAMAALVHEGKVRHLGVCEVTPAQLAEAVTVHPIAAVQFEWSLAWREPELDLIPEARRLGVGIVPYSPLGRGLLTATLDREGLHSSEFRRTDPRFQDANLERNLAQVAALRRLAATLGISPGQLALAWLLAQGSDVVPIPGTRRVDRIADNAAAADVALSVDDLRRLDEVVPPGAWAGDRRSFAVPATTRSGS